MTTCPYCHSTDLGEVLCDPPRPRYSRILCRACQRQLGWGAAPMTFERASSFVMPFGKHAGLTLAEIDEAGHRSYLVWLLSEGPKPNIQRALDAYLSGTEGGAS